MCVIPIGSGQYDIIIIKKKRSEIRKAHTINEEQKKKKRKARGNITGAEILSEM